MPNTDFADPMDAHMRGLFRHAPRAETKAAGFGPDARAFLETRLGKARVAELEAARAKGAVVELTGAEQSAATQRVVVIAQRVMQSLLADETATVGLMAIDEAELEALLDKTLREAAGGAKSLDLSAFLPRDPFAAHWKAMTAQGRKPATKAAEPVAEYSQHEARFKALLAESSDKIAHARAVAESLTGRKDFYPYGGATTIAQALAVVEVQKVAAALQQASDLYLMVVHNILDSAEIADKGAAVQAAAAEYAQLAANPAPLLAKAKALRA